MIKFKHYICPRGCGKTTKAIELFNENPKETILLTYPNNNKYLGIDNHKYDDHIKPCGVSLRGYFPKRIIIDEFIFWVMNMNHWRDRIMDEVHTNIISSMRGYKEAELILFSTPDKLRNSSSYLLLDTGIVDMGQIKNEFVNKERIMQEIMDFQRLFLTPGEVEIIKTNFGNEMKEDYKIYHKKTMSEEQYRTNILGEFLQ